jgi:hypothetical protein
VVLLTATQIWQGAAIGAAGTVIGSVTVIVGQRTAEKDRRARAAGAAWQLLRIELGNALDSVYEIRSRGEWPIGWHRTWAATWHGCRDVLLQAPPQERLLRPVATACARIDQLENAVNTGRPSTCLRLTDSDRRFLEEMQQLLEPACKALGYQPKNRSGSHQLGTTLTDPRS